MTCFKLAGCAGLAMLALAYARDARAVEAPGPDQLLFDHPYYACETNYYVATNGSDSNSGTSQGAPWATLQHANDMLPAGGAAAGSCINVAPGTYAKGVLINRGGNHASRKGYVTYRCEKMDACIVTDVGAGGQNGSFVWDTSTQPMTGNYVFIDGFTMQAAAETLYGQGIQLWDGNEFGPTAPNSVHHVWLINSVISGYGQSGVSMNDGEYFYVVHNTIFNNANVGCSAQGSGVSFAVLKAFSNYQRTRDDASNQIVNHIGSFNNAVEWNVVYNNAITQCGNLANPYDTDGNDIIMDTLNNAGSTNVVYPGSVLIAFNITFNAGARGIHLYNSENITVANNSCYNSDLDPYINGTYRPCIGDNYGYNNTFFNNLAYAIPVNAQNSVQCPVGSQMESCLVYNNAFAGGLTPGATELDSFTNNLSYCTSISGYGCVAMWNGDSFACTENLCNTNPLWVDVGSRSPGTETSKPANSNFALQPNSPAIGTGLVVSYLSPQSVDMGACSHLLKQCPWVRNEPMFKRPPHPSFHYTR
jgi:parallel beta-helix repeat protein